MYGTVMTAQLAGSLDEVREALRQWERERQVPGFVDAHVLLAEDGVTVIESVRFATKAQYQALADDPEQDRWWRERFAPLLASEPTWVDGTWIET